MLKFVQEKNKKLAESNFDSPVIQWSHWSDTWIKYAIDSSCSKYFNKNLLIQHCKKLWQNKQLFLVIDAVLGNEFSARQVDC